MKPAGVLSLYDISLAAVSRLNVYYKNEVRLLPDTVLFDLYMELYQRRKLCVVGMEFSDLDVFSKMLKITKSRVALLKCFEGLMSHGTGVARELAQSFTIKVDVCLEKELSLKENLIETGLRLGGFLSDAGWFIESISVLTKCKELALTLPENQQSWMSILYCCHKLLHAESVYFQFESASRTKQLAEETLQKLVDSGEKVCLAGIYTQFSVYSFYMSHYREAYEWGVKAVAELNPSVCPRVTVSALSQASKACVVKREFPKAEALVRLAVFLAAKHFGVDHPMYADTLLDYGFYLLNSDSMKDSVTVYEKALKLKLEVFGNDNLLVAVTHEDLAYALYVHEYSSGRFEAASSHANCAIDTMTQILPDEHLMLASAQRVKALILEEIALDYMTHYMDTQTHYLAYTEGKLLADAERLHKNALRLALASFGEYNVQTSKHYGNLGRLYQSMKKYAEAEEMHLKAIHIKEKLLGEDDYEVGLSVGHLASLYNYHMKEYRKAEALYFRSINISLKLFSETYSGLEYDYRGLVHVYEHLGETESVADYKNIIRRWEQLREEHERRKTTQLDLNEPPSTLESIQALLQP